MKKAPKWMKQLWNRTTWKKVELDMIIQHLENNDLRSFGDGSVREQWGAFAWCFTGKGQKKKMMIHKGAVHGHRNQMRAIRSEATYMLSVLCLLYTLQNFVTNECKVDIHTDCQGLLNKINDRNINRPSLVTSNHIDIVYQIRELISKLNIKINLIFTRAAPKEDPDNPPEILPTTEELLMQEMHVLATTYYHDAKSNKPSQHSVHFPAQKITITYAGNTIVADVANFLQNSERRLMREEYFENRMGIVPRSIDFLTPR